MTPTRIWALPCIVAGLMSAAAAQEIIYDSLCITDDDWADVTVGASCGGEQIYGTHHDLQAADDFVVEQKSQITKVTADYLTWLGECPAAACVQFYEDTGCGPSADPYWMQVIDYVQCEDWNYGGRHFYGLRCIVELEGCDLAAGRWWISVQPAMGDWGWWVGQKGDHPCGGDTECDAFVRDGGDRNKCCDGKGGFGFTDWRSSFDWVGDHYTLAMRIEGFAVRPTACCFADGSCRELYRETCAAEGGESLLGIECGDGVCAEPGACCFSDGTCEHLTADACDRLRGQFHSRTVCGDVECPKPTACCFSDGSCEELQESECLRRRGEWNEELTCHDAACPQTVGCCTRSFLCHDLLEEECERIGGESLGDESTCEAGCDWCERVRRVTVTCTPRSRIRATVVFRDERYDGYISVWLYDGSPKVATVHGNRAHWVALAEKGEHLVRLIQPECGEELEVSCP